MVPEWILVVLRKEPLWDQKKYQSSDFLSPGKILAMTLIDHEIQVILVFEAEFHDPQCQKLFVNLSLPCQYRNSCPIDSGYSPSDMSDRYWFNMNSGCLTVNRKTDSCKTSV